VIGQRIAHYCVQEKIGAGGMGEVYRAQDTRLCRDVALKVLPELFARDAERMVRFEREAKVLASLNHPNIASIYGLEESNGTRALVMELVEGPTFAERIRQERIPLEEVLTFAKQIADALEYAHERGIIHRDLKPSNVKLTPESQVKLLDFGLAKALEGETVEPELQNSPTLSAPSTRTGVLLGTAAYMSPEQARGKRVDRRADIWAFGCMLYEMLTGRAAFTGETTSDILASVIRAEPDWSSLPGSVPPRIRELLRRCLQKDAKQRLRDIGDARITIQEALSGSVASEGVPAIALTRTRRREMVAAFLFGAWFWQWSGLDLSAGICTLLPDDEGSPASRSLSPPRANNPQHRRGSHLEIFRLWLSLGTARNSRTLDAVMKPRSFSCGRSTVWNRSPFQVRLMQPAHFSRRMVSGSASSLTAS
jgi:serine/threonine protein kinase